jgi:hypothetical protein
MLDAYIIDRIRRERDSEKERGSLIPLRIDVPPTPPESVEDRPEPEDRGSTVVDYQL